jgi:tRNA pseudouridine13 synthase
MAEEDPPRKKIRLDNTNANISLENADLDKDLKKEIRVGITAFVRPDVPGFTGTLKQRFTDFLVNEIVPSGEVLHLHKIATPELFRGKAREKSTTGSDQVAVSIDNSRSLDEEAGNKAKESKPVDEEKGSNLEVRK